MRHAVMVTTAVLLASTPGMETAASAPADALVSSASPGHRGGRLVVPLRAEPRTLNPVLVIDHPSRDVVQMLSASLIRINRETHRTEPALAKSWRMSTDGRQIELHLRRGLSFSDGHAMTADDVVFTFGLYLDEKIASPHRDLLLIGGRPLVVRKVDDFTVRVELPERYAAAERLFDGIPVLPRHLLAGPQRDGSFARAWAVSTPPSAIAGMGPFRLKHYVPGGRIVLERNPYYWKVDRRGERLPYLDELVFTIVPGEEAQLARLRAGEADVVTRFSAENFTLLQRGGLDVRDLGAGLEYSFLFFNLNDLAPSQAEFSRRQQWFRETAFRQAVSAAIDRDAMVRLVYNGRGTALAGHVPPGNRQWMNTALPPPVQSLERSRRLLRNAGFQWDGAGRLRDPQGQLVDFTLLTSAGNAARAKMAALIQEDLLRLGIQVQVVPMEFRAMLDRITRTKAYDAAILGFGSGDADPNVEMHVWLSSGGSHFWRLAASTPLGAWETEIDRLMRAQLTTVDVQERKRQYDRVQALVAEHVPAIVLVSPNVLVAAKPTLANLRPAVLDPPVLWNADELFWTPSKTRGAF